MNEVTECKVKTNEMKAVLMAERSGMKVLKWTRTRVNWMYRMKEERKCRMNALSYRRNDMNAQQAKQGTVKREASAQGGNCNQINPIHSVASGNEMRSDNEWKIDWFRADWREGVIHSSHFTLISVRCFRNGERNWVRVKTSGPVHSINSIRFVQFQRINASLKWSHEMRLIEARLHCCRIRSVHSIQWMRTETNAEVL